MKKVKVDYKRHSKDGTIYDQTITIDKNFMELYNNFLLDKKIKIDNNFFKKHIYSEEDLKIKSINYLEKGSNFTNLIQLRLLLEFIINYNKNNNNKIDFKRIKTRNTIVKVI